MLALEYNNDFLATPPVPKFAPSGLRIREYFFDWSNFLQNLLATHSGRDIILVLTRFMRRAPHAAWGLN